MKTLSRLAVLASVCLAPPAWGQNAPPCFDATRACCARNGQRQHAPEFVFFSLSTRDLGSLATPTQAEGAFEGLNVSDEYIRIYSAQAVAAGLQVWASKEVVAPGDTFTIRYTARYGAQRGPVQTVVSVRVGPKDPPQEDLTACRTHTPYQTLALTLRAQLTSPASVAPTPSSPPTASVAPAPPPASGPQPECELSVAHIELGPVRAGASVPFRFNVRNAGAAPLQVGAPHAPPALQVRSVAPAQPLAPGAVWVVEGVLVAPPAHTNPDDNRLNYVLVFDTNDPDAPTQRVRISATCVR
jgi:hypothetical protein